MNKEKKLIPTLRFPEFKNDGEWKVKSLGLLTNITIGEFVIKTKQNPNSQYPVYNGGRSYTGFYEEYNNEANRIVISARGANAGFVNLVKQRYWAGNSCYSVSIIDQNVITIEFLFYFIKENQNRFTDNQQAANIPSVSKADVQKFIANFPLNLVEQQKIASCLSSLDEVIAAHSQKLDALKDHKKGLMQNLFPQEGETVPKWRFNEFVNDGEWEIGKLGDLVDTIMGNAFKSDDFVEEGIQLVRMGNLYQGELQLNRAPVFVPNKFEDEYSRFLIKPSDILMSMTGTVGKRDYGFVIQIPKICPKLMLNQRVLKIVPKINFTKEYILQLLKDESFLEKLFSLPGGTKQANLSVQQLNGITVYFPTNIEQQRIASCLSSLDALITAQADKIEQLKLHKKGLMQGLFPKIND